MNAERSAAAATPAPLAYVAETCGSGSTCSAPNGMVEVLGGATITDGVDSPWALTTDKAGNVYVGGYTSPSTGFVNVYPPHSTKISRTIANIAGEPHGLAVNASGRLFEVDQARLGCCQIVGSGWVYKAGSSTPLRRLEGVSGFPHPPIFDKSGNAYIANFETFPGWVDVYAPGRNIPSRTIQNGIGFTIGNGIALTPNDALVVLNVQLNHAFDVEVYPKGASSPSLTITHRLLAPTGVAVDAAGNIYVANNGTKKIASNITVYPNGKTYVGRTIRTGVNTPVALAFDGAGRLYVANEPANATNYIAVYAPGGSTPIKTYNLKQQISVMFVPK